MLFLLYINGVVTRLHAGNCGVQCGGDKLPGLLFADTRLWLPRTRMISRRVWIFWWIGVKNGG